MKIPSRENLKIGIVVGTRPEFVKFFSTIRALQRHGIDFFIVHTGQHYSKELDSVFFRELDLPEPRYHLSLTDLPPGEHIGRMVVWLTELLKRERPTAILVEGDTNTVMAGALASSKLGIPVGNIEAGLRSNNFSMAEEKNRILANQLSTFLFAPTDEARHNLLQEGFDKQKIYLVGNTIADAVAHFAPRTEGKAAVAEALSLQNGKYFLVTIHRAEATDSREHLANIVSALNQIQKTYGYPVVFPMHPRTRKYLAQYGLALDPRITVLDPVGYFDFLHLLKNCLLVLTDSGGVQEEACILRRPTVTIRTETERPETVRVGSNIVVGYDVQKIIAGVSAQLQKPVGGGHPYGRENGEKIVQIIKGNLEFSKLKKVLIVSDTYLPLVGGAELYTLNFARHLLHFGYDVTIVTNSEASAGPEEPEGAVVIRAAWPGWRNPFGMVKLYARLVSLMRKHDIVFSNYTYRMSFIGSLAVLTVGKPFFVFAHGLGTILDKDFPWAYHAYRFVSLKVSRGVIATSTEIADIVKKYNKNVMVATAVDFSSINAKVCENDVGAIKKRFAGKKIILTVRRLVPKNGVQYLLAMLPYLARTRQDFVCLMIGGGRLEGYLRGLARKNGIENKVYFEGEVENDRVFSYMKAADVVAFPSSAEAMSLACIEAMYLGKPVVASAIGGLIELISADESRGHLVDLFGRSESVYSAPDVSAIAPPRYEEFARKMSAALDTLPGDQKVARAKAYVEAEFDWGKATNDILDFVRYTHSHAHGQ